MKPLLFLCALATAAAADTVTFDKDHAGSPPEGWTVGLTGKGKSKWTVEQDTTAPSKPNVLKQSAEGTYPFCVREGTSLTDGYVEVKFKSVSGKEDQAAGVIWRFQDANNYYVARANALEDNVAIYHTIAGKRTEKKRAQVKVTPGEWHTLRVDFHGARFVVTFDGRETLQWDDSTFSNMGNVGLWTKADSVTLFDDFRYGEITNDILKPQIRR